MSITSNDLFKRRCRRNRYKLKAVAKKNSRPRLSVFRSNKHIFAQLIDDSKRVTLCAASSVSKEFNEKAGWNVKAAEIVGKMIAERALKAGVKEVLFDRGGYDYHGRVKALAEAARAGGLVF